MTHSRSRKLALGLTAVALALMVGLVGLQRGENRRQAAGVSARSELELGASKKPTGATGVSPGISAAELKALIEKVHPGMPIPDELEAMVDITKLPLVERERRMERALVAHEREAWDSTWATTTEERLSSEFTLLASRAAFEVGKVECRTSSCLVTLHWADREAGEAVYKAVVSTPIGLGCQLEMLPPAAGARQAQAYLDCSRQQRMDEGAVRMVATVTGAVPTKPEGRAGPQAIP